MQCNITIERCVLSTIFPQIVFGIRSVHAGDVMNGYDVVFSVLLSTTNCFVVPGERIAPEIALTNSMVINYELENMIC